MKFIKRFEKKYATFQNKKYKAKKLIKEVSTGFIYSCCGFFVRNLKIFKVIVQRFQMFFGFWYSTVKNVAVMMSCVVDWLFVC